MIDNTAHIVGIELLAAAQGSNSCGRCAVRRRSRAHMRCCARSCPPMPQDRYLAPDIERATALVRDGALGAILKTIEGLPPLWNPV